MGSAIAAYPPKNRENVVLAVSDVSLMPEMPILAAAAVSSHQPMNPPGPMTPIVASAQPYGVHLTVILAVAWVLRRRICRAWAETPAKEIVVSAVVNRNPERHSPESGSVSVISNF